MNENRPIPFYKVGATVYSTDLNVTADDTGQYWLTPAQIRQLKEMRAVASLTLKAGPS